MTLRTYPSNAPHAGTTTLVGNGSASDIFTFPAPSLVVVQNNTAATVYVSLTGADVAAGGAAVQPATQGDEAVPSGSEYTSSEVALAVAVYGPAGTKVNGSAAGGLMIYGLT